MMNGPSKEQGKKFVGQIRQKFKVDSIPGLLHDRKNALNRAHGAVQAEIDYYRQIDRQSLDAHRVTTDKFVTPDKLDMDISAEVERFQNRVTQAYATANTPDFIVISTQAKEHYEALIVGIQAGKISAPQVDDALRRIRNQLDFEKTNSGTPGMQNAIKLAGINAPALVNPVQDINAALDDIDDAIYLAVSHAADREITKEQCDDQLNTVAGKVAAAYRAKLDDTGKLKPDAEMRQEKSDKLVEYYRQALEERRPQIEAVLESRNEESDQRKSLAKLYGDARDAAYGEMNQANQRYWTQLQEAARAAADKDWKALHDDELKLMGIRRVLTYNKQTGNKLEADKSYNIPGGGKLLVDKQGELTLSYTVNTKKGHTAIEAGFGAIIDPFMGLAYGMRGFWNGIKRRGEVFQIEQGARSTASIAAKLFDPTKPVWVSFDDKRLERKIIAEMESYGHTVVTSSSSAARPGASGKPLPAPTSGLRKDPWANQGKKDEGTPSASSSLTVSPGKNSPGKQK